MTTNTSQNAKLFDHLVTIGSITGVEAYTLYQVMSFHRRMADLRDKMGVKFRKERKFDHIGRPYVKYHFAGVSA